MPASRWSCASRARGTSSVTVSQARQVRCCSSSSHRSATCRTVLKAAPPRGPRIPVRCAAVDNPADRAPSGPPHENGRRSTTGCSAAECVDLPDPAPAGDPQADRARRGRRASRPAGVRTSGTPCRPAEQQVLRADEGADHQVARRVAEDQQAPCVVGRGAEQPLVVGVAAHHPVQDDDVGRLDRRRVRGDVERCAARRVRPGRPRRASAWASAVVRGGRARGWSRARPRA